MFRLLADENFPFPAVIKIRQKGWDIVTLQESGYGGIALNDSEVLQFALSSKRAVLTLNRRHFIHLHSVSDEHYGIIVCSFDSDFDGLSERIICKLSACDSPAGKLIRINRPE
jgi:hypothetical protein